MLDNTDRSGRFDNKVSPISTLDVILDQSWRRFRNVDDLITKLEENPTAYESICHWIGNPFLLGFVEPSTTLCKTKTRELKRVEEDGGFRYDVVCKGKKSADKITIPLNLPMQPSDTLIVTDPFRFSLNKTPYWYTSSKRPIRREQRLIQEIKKPYWTQICRDAYKEKNILEPTD